MMLPELPPLFAAVAAPLFLSMGTVPLILQADTMLERRSLHPLDTTDPAGWGRAVEWLPGAPVEKRFGPPASPSSSSRCSVTEHSSGRWRTLHRHGAVQSVTPMRPRFEGDGYLFPFHSSVGNEYLKVMASVYAALSSDGSSSSSSVLHLGLGGGSLPMLIGEPCTAIELDEDVVDLAIKFCGLDPRLVSIVGGGDALHHRVLAPGPHSCVFVDVVGDDDNVPSSFVKEEFVRDLWNSLCDGGLAVANFHYNGGRSRADEDLKLHFATRVYSRVFGPSRLVRIPSRYQGNMILCARKEGRGGSFPSLSLADLDIDAARRVAHAKGWMFDPGSRLEGAEAVPVL